MRSDRTLTRVFVDSATEKVSAEGELDIVLSPSFYWVKYSELPVRSIREVMRLMPAIFDDILPEGSYRYHARRKGEGYLLFAYDQQAILQQLASKGVEPSRIASFSLAQGEFEEYDKAVRIDEASVLICREGIVIKVPSGMVADAVDLSLSKKGNPSERIGFTPYASWGTARELAWAGSIAVGAALVLGLQWWMVAKENQTLNERLGEVQTHHQLKPTTMQNDAVLGALERRHSTQVQMRKAVESVTALRLRKGERLESLSTASDRLVASIGGVDAQRRKALERESKLWAFNVKTSFAGKRLTMEMTW
jgi:hypothetical protein